MLLNFGPDFYAELDLPYSKKLWDPTAYDLFPCLH